MKSGVYQILHLETGRCYIGSAVNLSSRSATHKCLLRLNRHPNRKLQAAWSKHGETAFTFKVLLLCDKADLIFYEQRCIDAYQSVSDGYNLLSVAGSALGFRHSEAHKARLRNNKFALGYRHNGETLKRISDAGKGNRYSLGHRHKPEFGARISARLKGKPQSPEHIEARIKVHRGAKRSPTAIANMEAAWERRRNNARGVKLDENRP